MGSIKIIKSGILGILMLFSLGVSAQTWSEWFSQKKTQQKYLLEQLAALKLYSGYLKKGYEISKFGLSFIKDASKGEFNLHEAFFSSLKTVSPEIIGSGAVAQIFEKQLSVRRVIKGIDVRIESFPAHSDYLVKVKNNLQQSCLDDLEELVLVLASGKLEMGDEERIFRIDKINAAMEEKEAFAQSFLRSLMSMERSKNKELEVLNRMEEWYEK
ncbi:hypothetical protein [Pedobacter mucosus]|uniref:hypothetical protein n=1 Tax=Pedobacter mucosus TaxID=2895286 RepID=UPI001EE4D0AC|nr:hypothetical protein [Pedobacter mucosus]UKT65069.1 hypothetical protein LOK61_04655 [Pedobacter mucosus]